jgi:hypothetical protein
MPAPVILFGAFDRHNFGDLLFPHIAAALLPGRELLFAGLAERDLRDCGGHQVQALHRLAAEGRTRGAQLLHVGGEILTCTARQAAVMLLQPDEVGATLGYLEAHPEEEIAWRQAMLGTADAMPYVASREQWPGLDRTLFCGVGGVALAALAPADRQAVYDRLAAAEVLAVRDATTLAALQTAGLAPSFVPDPAVMVDVLFGSAIRRQATQRPLAELRDAFPQGYLAVQLSAEFADDATLEVAAAQLKAVRASTGLGLVLFRAGAAPWHDDLAMLERLAARFAAGEVQLFRSLQLWDVCALLAGAAAYAGSSLHGWIVAAAFGVPALGLAKPQDDGKLAAYVRTWAGGEDPPAWPLARLAEGMQRRLGAAPQARRQQALQCAAAYRAAFQEFSTHLA